VIEIDDICMQTVHIQDFYQNSHPAPPSTTKKKKVKEKRKTHTHSHIQNNHG